MARPKRASRAPRDEVPETEDLRAIVRLPVGQAEEGPLDVENPLDPEREPVVPLVPQQLDEFTCRQCFLVRHRSQVADPVRMICYECRPAIAV